MIMSGQITCGVIYNHAGLKKDVFSYSVIQSLPTHNRPHRIHPCPAPAFNILCSLWKPFVNLCGKERDWHLFHCLCCSY